MKLSEKQQIIVDFEEGPLLVKAGPGSGKTRVLIERVKKLLKTKRRVKILALTFSNMAADEMKSRLQEDPEVADYIENVTVGTIHSFCLDLVQNRGYLIGLSDSLVLFESLDDRKKVLEDALNKNIKLKTIYARQDDKGKYLSNCLSYIADCKKQFITPSANDINSEIYSVYNDQLLLQGAIDFDDILFYAYRILTENPNVAALFTTQYKYVCVDEAQDLNFSQYSVIKALCGSNFRNIMFVGDVNQSIYKFNGSDSNLMSVEFVRDFSPTVYELNENFRCAKSIVRYANTLESSNDYPNCYYEGELQLHIFDTEKEEACSILEKITELIRNGHSDIEKPLNFDDFAIIARNKYVFSAIENLFEEKSIPYHLKKPSTGIESESLLFQYIDLKLRIIANPKDIIHKEQLRLVEDNLSKAYDINKISALVEEITPDELEMKTLLKKIEEYINSLKDISDDDKLLSICDLDLWRKHWSKYISQVARENRTLMSFRNYVALGKTQFSNGSDGVTLLTAHMSKGLQFEVVFVIGLSQGTFPDYRAVNEGGDALEQEKNNMYVAVTRAKRLCYLSYARNKKMPWGDVKVQKASQFLTNLN